MSNVPDIQQALVALLQAHFATEIAADTMLVRFAPPLKKVEERERIYILDEEDYRLGGGEQWREETFTARLVVEVFQSGDDPQGASDRRWELIDAIDALLTADDFRGYETEGHQLRVVSALFTPDDKNYVARSVVSLDVEEHV